MGCECKDCVKAATCQQRVALQEMVKTMSKEARIEDIFNVGFGCYEGEPIDRKN